MKQPTYSDLFYHTLYKCCNIYFNFMLVLLIIFFFFFISFYINIVFNVYTVSIKSGPFFTGISHWTWTICDSHGIFGSFDKEKKAQHF